METDGCIGQDDVMPMSMQMDEKEVHEVQIRWVLHPGNISEGLGPRWITVDGLICQGVLCY